MGLCKTIEHHGPCSPAIAFLSQYDDWQAAWDACQRPDWMTFLLYHYLTPAPGNVRRLCRLAFDHYAACAHLLQPNLRPVIDPLLASLRDWAFDDGAADLFMVEREKGYAEAVLTIIRAVGCFVIEGGDESVAAEYARKACRCLTTTLISAVEDNPDAEFLSDRMDAVQAYATEALTCAAEEGNPGDYAQTQADLHAAACDRIRKHFPTPPLPTPKADADTPETVPAVECD